MKKYKNILKNREITASELFQVIPSQKLKDENLQIIAVSKGGLEIAHYLAKKYSNKINILFSQAIMAPNNSECEIARVSEHEEIVINEDIVKSFSIKYDYIYGEAHRKHEETILSYIYKYRKGRPFPNIDDKSVLIVDDGAETGLKLMTALKTVLAQRPKAVYIAVPVIPSDVLELLEPYADEIFYLYNIDDYVETSLYYEDFPDIDEERIEKLLRINNEI
jgi:putative phosphoribosyl transferase